MVEQLHCFRAISVNILAEHIGYVEHSQQQSETTQSSKMNVSLSFNALAVVWFCWRVTESISTYKNMLKYAINRISNRFTAEQKPQFYSANKYKLECET